MEFIIAVFTLILLEIILGVDNIMFISIVTNKLPNKRERNKARILGLTGAMFVRILFLVLMVWLIENLRKPFFPVEGQTLEETIALYKGTDIIWDKMKILFHTIGVRELILLAGGLFLMIKSTSEIYHRMEGEAKELQNKKRSLWGTVIEIMAVDIVFSFDSILTAIGITENLPAMIVAVIIAIIIMMVFSAKVAEFMKSHPSLEVMGLSFLILIGVMLVLDSVHYEVPRGYLYFAIFFSLAVELVNMNIRRKQIKQPLELKSKIKDTI